MAAPHFPRLAELAAGDPQAAAELERVLALAEVEHRRQAGLAARAIGAERHAAELAAAGQLWEQYRRMHVDATLDQASAFIARRKRWPYRRARDYLAEVRKICKRTYAKSVVADSDPCCSSNQASASEKCQII